jgi:outer membrane protein assembly factor BamB
MMMKPRHMTVMVMTASLMVATLTGAQGADWARYRGATVPELPQSLPKGKWEPLWKMAMSDECHAGIAVADGVVVVPDRGDGHDFYRAYDAVTGKQLWENKYPNEREMDYGPGPRATPLIYKGKTYVVSAFGEAYCFDLKTGKEVWKKNYSDYGGSDPGMWGYCTSPIEVNGKVILFPSDLVAVDPDTGKEAWRGSASGPSYATPIVGKFGGVEQIVGFDGGSLNGWDAKSGKPLWNKSVSTGDGFIVPSPVVVGDKVFFSHAGEGAKLFSFDADGKIANEPAGENADLNPDTLSPAAIGNFVLGPSAGLMCLDAKDGLKQLWLEDKDDVLSGAQHIVPGKELVLVFSDSGSVALVKIGAERPTVLGSHKIYGGSFSFPAVANGRLYVRDSSHLYCYDLTGKSSDAKSAPEPK